MTQNAVLTKLSGKLLSPLISGPTGKAGRFGFRGELGLEFPESVAGEARPPITKADQVILAAEGGPLVAPVDEVDGIYPLLPDRTGASGLTHALLHWRGRSLRVLDPVALLELAVRSLA